jgi:hypothetical protein
MKVSKYVALILAILISFNSFSFAATLGDANENGKLDVADAIIILQTLVGLRPADGGGISYTNGVVGYSKTYDVTPSNGTAYTVITTVISSNSSGYSIKSQNSNGTTYGITDYIYDGTALMIVTSYSYNADGTLLQKYEYTPALLTLPSSMAKNTTESAESATIATSGTGATVMTSVQTRFIRVNGEESVTTPAGTFTAMKTTQAIITTPSTGTATVQTTTAWNVKNIGNVKSVSSYTSGGTIITTTQVLRSYSQTSGSGIIYGYWQFFNTPSGQTERRINPVLFSQTNNVVNGTALCGSTWAPTGTVIGNTITLNWTENVTPASITGTINGDNMSGSYNSTSENGTWRAVKVTIPTCDTTRPTVVSTNPTNGATGVSRSVDNISVTFSEPMNANEYRSGSANWPTSGTTPHSWDSTMTIYTIGRDSVGLLPANTLISITLGDPTNYNVGFKDIANNALNPSPFTVSFTTGEN